MSVRIGRPVRSLMSASVRNPDSRPGPRNDETDVRLALSNEALKMTGAEHRRAMSRIDDAGSDDEGKRLPAADGERADLDRSHAPILVARSATARQP